MRLKIFKGNVVTSFGRDVHRLYGVVAKILKQKHFSNDSTAILVDTLLVLVTYNYVFVKNSLIIGAFVADMKLKPGSRKQSRKRSRTHRNYETDFFTVIGLANFPSIVGVNRKIKLKEICHKI